MREVRERARFLSYIMVAVRPPSQLPCTCPKMFSLVNMTSIKEVRRGQNTESFVANGNKHDEARSFSLIYGDDYKSLDLVAASDEEANVWILGLGYVLDENFGK